MPGLMKCMSKIRRKIAMSNSEIICTSYPRWDCIVVQMRPSQNRISDHLNHGLSSSGSED